MAHLMTGGGVQSAPFNDGISQGSSKQVRFGMGIRIQQKLGTRLLRQSRYVTVGQTVTMPGADFKEDAARCRLLCLLQSEQSRVS